MPRLRIDVGGKPLLDIASYARRGPSRRDRLSTEELELIRRTVQRTPEVMVKVLPKGGRDLGSVRRHLAYISRYGELELQADNEAMVGKGTERGLVENWDLDIEENRRRADLGARRDRRPPKLVHKFLFSMPPGTPAKKVLEAVKNFAREEFALKHRYALVLHTDEPHPHVHFVIKAVSEQGVRLHIRKETLRQWRRQFARHLQDQGVPANATERAVRGQTRTHKTDGIFRAARRGASTHIRKRAEDLARELSEGDVLQHQASEARLLKTRGEVESGWRAIGKELSREGQPELAAEVMRFVDEFRLPRTEKELLAHESLVFGGELRGPLHHH